MTSRLKKVTQKTIKTRPTPPKAYFMNLEIGQLFLKDGKLYRKCVRRYAKNGRYMGNANCAKTGKIARFPETSLVTPYEEQT